MMKIVVNNEREKEMFQQLLFFMADYIDSEQLQKVLYENDYVFKEHEIEFLRTGLGEATIHVDEREWEIVIDSDNLSGECRYCGEEWRGVEDENNLGIERYEDFLDSDEEISYHTGCYRENRCDSCGADDEDADIVKGVAHTLCENCLNYKESVHLTGERDEAE